MSLEFNSRDVSSITIILSSNGYVWCWWIKPKGCDKSSIWVARASRDVPPTLASPVPSYPALALSSTMGLPLTVRPTLSVSLMLPLTFDAKRLQACPLQRGQCCRCPSCGFSCSLLSCHRGNFTLHCLALPGCCHQAALNFNTRITSDKISKGFHPRWFSTHILV